MENKYNRLFDIIGSSFGVSGYSYETAKAFKDFSTGLGFISGIDSIGSVSSYLPQKTRRQKNVVITAHLDTIGYVVCEYPESKEIAVSKVGSPYLEGSQSGMLLSSSGKKIEVKITDIEEDTEEEGVSDFAYIEIKNKADLEHIRIGDPIAYYNPPVNKPQGKYTGAYMDNKASIVAMMLAMENLVKHQPTSALYNVYFILTSMEEIGSHGVKAAIQKIKPEFAINMDVFPVYGKRQLSDGVYISRGPFINDILYNFTRGLAVDNKIPHKTGVGAPSDGSDVEYIIPINGGTPVCEIGVPCVGLHTPEEIVSKKGLQSTADLLSCICRNIDQVTSLIEKTHC